MNDTFSFQTDKFQQHNLRTLKPKYQSLKCSPVKVSGSSTCESTVQEWHDWKKTKKQLEIKVIELENEIKFLKDQLLYKKDLNERDLENQRCFLQCEYTLKVRQVQTSLRKQLIKPIQENSELRQKVKRFQEEAKLMKQKFERSEKYGKEVEEMYKKTVEEQRKVFEEEKDRIGESFRKDIQNVKRLKDDEQRIKSKQFNYELQILKKQNKKLKQLIQQLSAASTKQTNQMQQIKLQNHQLKIQKTITSKSISQQETTNQIFKQNTALQDSIRRKKIQEDQFQEFFLNSTLKLDKENRKDLAHYGNRYQNSLGATLRNIETSKQGCSVLNKIQFSKRMSQNERGKSKSSCSSKSQQQSFL